VFSCPATHLDCRLLKEPWRGRRRKRDGEAAAQLRYGEWRGSSTAQVQRMERQQHSSGTDNREAAAQLRYG